MLDLEAGVQLHEVEAVVGGEQELERSGVRVADHAAGALDGALHLQAQLGRGGRRGRLLDQLLVPALDRALSLAQREHAAEGVAENLHLDVTSRHNCPLHVERTVAKGGLGLVGGGRIGVLELGGIFYKAHALAATTGRRLEQERIAELLRTCQCARERAHGIGAGHERNVRRHQLPLRLGLVAHPAHQIRARADEDEAGLLAGLDEGGVLGKEAVAGVNSLAAGRLCGADHVRDAEVALARRRRTDANRLVGQANVERIGVGGRVDGYGLDAELVQRANDADCDLTTIGYQYTREHSSISLLEKTVERAERLRLRPATLLLRAADQEGSVVVERLAADRL